MKINKNICLKILKIIISILFGIYLIAKINLGEMLQIIKMADPFLLAGTFVLLNINNIVLIDRWKSVLRSLNINIHIKKLMIFHYSSLFFGQFLLASYC